MDRTIFTEEHDLFRDAFRRFCEREIVPNQQRWRENGQVDRETWHKAGEAGFLCTWLDPEYGGPGADFICSLVIIEELARVGESGFAMPLHSDIIVPYVFNFGDETQKERWLPGLASGQLVSALAMTEPGTGSDLAAMTTTAKRDGDDYVINGAKTFISNAILCDLCVVAAKTENSEDPHSNISLFVVEADRPGFIKGKKLEKMGMMSQDTAELQFDDCRIPAQNRLGAEGAGFLMLMRNLQQERLVVGMSSQAGARAVFDETMKYVQERHAFGRPIAKFQNTQFKLAEVATEIEVGQAFLDALVTRHVAGDYLVKECSMSKLWHSEMFGRVVDECLQFFGGYGYMLEYPIAHAYMDARVQRIYAGTNEIMKVIIAKQLGL